MERLEAVIAVLDALRVPYLIGGSFASAVHGMARTTLATDIVADLRLKHVAPLVSALQDRFYVDEAAVHEALRDRSSFNLIHLTTMFKVDIFLPTGRPYDQAEFAHRAQRVVATDPERTAYVASTEGTILTKLEWYRLDGEVSERQWRDVLGILKAQGTVLDIAYLQEWAQPLGVADLLELALSASSAQD